MKFSNFKIGKQVAAGFGLVLFLLLLVVATGLQRFQAVGDATTALVDEDWAIAKASAIIDMMTRANARRTLELFIAPDDVYCTTVRDKIATNRHEVDGALATLRSLVASGQAMATLGRVFARREDCMASFARVDVLICNGQVDLARQLMLANTLPRLDALQREVHLPNVLQKQRAVDGPRPCKNGSRPAAR